MSLRNLTLLHFNYIIYIDRLSGIRDKSYKILKKKYSKNNKKTKVSAEKSIRMCTDGASDL